MVGLLNAAIQAAQPSRCLPLHLDALPRPLGRTVVVGAGKAAGGMAAALEDHWGADLSGLVVVPYGVSSHCRRIRLVNASHPVPDENSCHAAQQMLEAVADLTSEDLVVGLWSGGGSALLALPAPELTLDDKRQITHQLLRSGAAIAEVNCVRKHLSGIKGGRLATACIPARVHSFVISDIPGDDLSLVASGPLFPDGTTLNEALHIFAKYRLDCPASVTAHLSDLSNETPKPADPAFRRSSSVLIASSQISLEAAAAQSRKLGVAAHVLSDRIEGEAREVAKAMGAIALQVANRQQPFNPPCVLLSGGECSVTVRGSGNGGRNAEFLAALAQCLQSHPAISAISADTDGIDGNQPVAGAYVDSTTLSRASALGFNVQQTLERNDAHTLFAALDDQLITGPTGTNVNDFRAILITAQNPLPSH